MPKKKDGMPFVMHPTPAKGKDGKILYYPRPLNGMKKTIEELDEYCAKYYGLRPFELTRAFQAFVTATGFYLSEGYRIETPIGSFAPRLRTKREITDPDDVKGSDVFFDGVEYNSGKVWHKSVEKWLEGFRPAVKTNLQDVLANPDKLEAKMRECIQKYNGYVTARLFGYHAGLTYYSARKQLDEWTKGDNPKLLKTRRGQEYIYTEI